MAKPQLYSYWRSSCAWRVRIALALKGIEYDYRAVHLVKDGGEQHKDEYSAKNPMEQLPTIEIDGITLTQSILESEVMRVHYGKQALLVEYGTVTNSWGRSPLKGPIQVAILEYLEETRPDVSLLPKTPAARAQVRALCETIASGIQPLQNLSVLQYISDDNEKRAEWSRHWIDKGFTAFEKMISKTAGKYCVGDEITLADLCLVPQIYNANRFKVEMEKFPIISRIGAELASLDAFKAAHPDAQPDCPEKS